MNIHRLLISFLLLALTATLLAQIPEDCADRQQANSWPEYYCDCKYNYQDFTLPLDMNISQSTWFRGKISNLVQGISAYLHSDCEFKFSVYLFCTSDKPEYEVIFAQNQANSIDGSSILRKLEEAGYGDSDAQFYICITPINGLGGRLIMRSEADGMPSSCDDPLYIFPGMSLYSTQPSDVYVIDPSNIAEATDIIIHWDGDNNTPCELKLTSNSCDGALVDKVTLDAPNNCYTLTAELLDEAWFNDEKFYLHFNHAPNTAGFVHCLVPEYTAVYTDTTICQGMGVQLADTLLTEPTAYPIDTVFLHTNQYRVNYLNVNVVEPEIAQDTLAFKYSQQPYIYRNQHTISKPGDYDLTIHTPGACDERYMLHVYHQVDTIVQVSDTSICYGGIFKYDGKTYSKSVTLVQSYWKNNDTLVFDTLKVYFATLPEIIKDTVKIGERYYGKTFFQAGDYSFLYTNPQTFCKDSILLHVLEGSSDGIEYEYIYKDTTLCEGKTYNHWGTLYTSSTVVYDTIPVSDNYQEIEVTTITFTEPENVYESIYIEQSQLPYIYREQTIDSFGEYVFTLSNIEGCSEIIHLSVIQKSTPTSLDNPSVGNRPQLILRDGVVYVLRGSEMFTVLGEKI